MNTRLINRHDYPQLDAILWDRAEQYIEPRTAFRLYEERWRFVVPHQLESNERALIAELIRTYGQMLTA
ncbi:hypothetical protein [Halomonas sp. BM-2019]|uniref:hypothetical protein n=1 Tax=Halomonas sp. BM-2019 TaxID=2811227 RepID=UPI001B3C1FB8|nr:MAG: hypothetical protein J5F18_10885 [Halomonas sp. BM-2019]